MEVNNVAPNDVERHIREYSMKNALANEVSTSMVELGIGDTKSRPSRETRLFVSSWNMGNEPATGLEHLIPHNGGDFDIFAFGLQESTYDVKTEVLVAEEAKGTPQKRASMTENKELACVEILQCKLQSCLGDDFYLVVHNRRVQMQLFVYARKELEQSISQIEKSSENTGFLHVFPNKGGINVSMSVDGTTLAFVSCHLAAHEGVAKCAQRNQSCYEILEGIRAGVNQDLDVAVQFHHTIWMGDMNYRTTFDSKTPTATTSIPPERDDARPDSSVYTAQVSGVTDDDREDFSEEMDTGATREENMKEVFRQIKECNYAAILAKDELNRELSANRVLMGFTALQPDFNPTFKRKRRLVLRDEDKDNEGHTVADYYDHKRMPSFTDRILYHSLPAFTSKLSPLLFDSCEATDSSDHKPVFAKFILETHGGVNDITVPRAMLNYVKNSNKHIKMHADHFTEYRITDLKGYNLSEMDLALFGVGGKSDPYVRITVDPPNAICRPNSKLESRVIKHELNPNWGKEELSVVCWGADKVGIATNVHLLISVWDWDLGNPHDLIGTCAVPLSVVIAASEKDKTFKFRLPLLRNGTFHGELEGTIFKTQVKNRKGSALSLGSAQSFSPNDSADIPLPELLEFLNASPAPDGMGCGCSIS